MDTYRLVKEYFLSSTERRSAWLLLLGIIASVVGMVVLLSLFATWSVGFWTALSVMDMALYMASIQTFVLLTFCYIGVNVFKDYLVGILTINWRTWLTTRLIEKYTERDGNNYLDLSRHREELPNPDQRIQEDINIFVEQALSLSINLFQSIITFATFIGSLWVIGGSLTVGSITIPGYLVWVAITYAAVATGLTHLIGRSLATHTNNQQNLEAGLRADLQSLSTNAESIALDHGETHYRQSLSTNVNAINRNSHLILGVRINLSALNAFYQQISSIVPYILAAPLYFSGLVNLGVLMQIGFSFGAIQSSLSWLSDSYEDVIRFSTSAARITALDNSMNEGLSTTARDIRVEETESNEVSVEHLDIGHPTNPHCVMRNLNLRFRPGENTLIKGPSGLGKSTFFKAMAGTWEYGRGDVFVPRNKKMYFLPQKPCLPNDTLRVVLAYPDDADTYDDAQYESVLRKIGCSDLIPRLHTKADWSNQTSAGQQQRISFARALLKNPDWLFLDEATSALDEENERLMYTLIENLQGTTFISIGHRSTITPFHKRVVTLKADEDQNVTYDDDSGLGLAM